MIMKKTILNEIDNMKYLFNYDRSKTINEQQGTPVPTPPATGSTEPPVPTPPASGSTVGSGPIPAPADGEVFDIGTALTPENPPENPPNAQASSASAITPGGSGDPYQYKYEDDGTTQKYFYAKKGQENWKQSTNPKSVEAIKKNIFKIR